MPYYAVRPRYRANTGVVVDAPTAEAAQTAAVQQYEALRPPPVKPQRVWPGMRNYLFEVDDLNPYRWVETVEVAV